MNNPFASPVGMATPPAAPAGIPANPFAAMASPATLPPLATLPPHVAVPPPAAAAPPAPTDPNDVYQTDQLVAEFIQLRDQQAVLKARHKEELLAGSDRMEAIESSMLARLDSSGVKSMATESGTAYKTIKKQYQVKDSDAYIQWVIANQQYQILTRAVAKTALDEYIDQGGAVPPGVNVHQEVVVQFRK